MKNIITIGGGIGLIWLLLSKKEIKSQPEILIPADLPQVTNDLQDVYEEPKTVQRETNQSISPLLTTNVISDIDRIVNALADRDKVYPVENPDIGGRDEGGNDVGEFPK